MQNQNDGVGNNPITQTNNLRSMFQHHGNQCLKFHFSPFLNPEERTKMRCTCKTIKQNILQPQYSYFKTKRSGAARARIETNTGFVDTCGNSYGADSSAVRSELQSDVKNIVSTFHAFAALKKNGRVITWGHHVHGGDSLVVRSDLQSDVKAVFSTGGSFAALNANGRVITWGSNVSGGDSSSMISELQSDVKNIFSTWYAFAASKANGRVITWGHRHHGGDSSSVISELRSDVKNICSNFTAFAALKTNGRVITWGHPGYGGDSSSVSEFLQNGVIQIEAVGNTKFRATKSDGTQIQWP